MYDLELAPGVIDRLCRYIDVRGFDECWPWLGSRVKGDYGQFSVGSGELRKMWKANRLVFCLCCVNLPDGWLACHTCDNGWCCNPTHMFAGTSKDNMQDMVRKGRNPDRSGERNPMYGRPGPMRGRTGEANPWFGRKHSEETRAKMGAAQRKAWKEQRRD